MFSAIKYQKFVISYRDHFNWAHLLSNESRDKCLQSIIKFKPKLKGEINKPSAILIPIVKLNNDGYGLLYTLRSSKLRHHVRQVSFPGGRQEVNESFEECALRETEEEIGLHRSDIDVWGRGHYMETYNNAGIMPIIGVVKNYPNIKLKINNDEVEKVFTVSFAHLCAPNNQKQTQSREGWTLPTFIGAEEKIWGITGIITHRFLMSFLPRELYNNKLTILSKYTS